MCPACFANLVLVAIGATSSGGLTAFALSKVFRQMKTKGTNDKRGEKNDE